MNDVVVGVDTSEASHRAAVAAAELAAAFNVNLHIVTCAHPSAPVDVGIGSDRVHLDWESEAEGFLKDLARDLPYDRITMAVETGDPAGVLCDEATRLGASRIVVGNRRGHGASRILGSVASKVLRKAPCDVLIAHTN